MCLNTNVEVKTCENAAEGEDKEECEFDGGVAQFISETPKFEVITIGGFKNRFTRVVHDDDAAVCREEAARRALCKLRGEDVGDFRGNRSIK